ncbi:MAG: batA, partial [Chlamydiia bacterium]|nr:batA [Chlamydiia bacterium]
SGSMADPLIGKESKIDWVKATSKKFINDRTNDLIGLIGFARGAKLISPLTNDREELLKRLDTISVIQNEEENGTAIGYAIFKAVNILVSTQYFAERLKDKREPAYDIKNHVIIVLTDGLQSPNPLDRDNPFRFMRPEEAIHFAEQNGIRVYFVGITQSKDEKSFLEQTKKLQEAVLRTNGGFFLATKSIPLDQIYAKIDQLEKKEMVVTEKSVSGTSLVPLCLILGLISLFTAVTIETLLARTFP